MKANELRIGNWVNEYDALGGLFYSQVGWGIIGDLVDGLIPCEPIPLTLEILEKAGFDRDYVFEKWGIYLKKHDYDTDRLTFRESEGFICFDGIKYRTLFPHIKYLHQLQNLYFALTGEELDINL
jgi:hypothetical protein